MWSFSYAQVPKWYVRLAILHHHRRNVLQPHNLLLLPGRKNTVDERLQGTGRNDCEI